MGMTDTQTERQGDRQTNRQTTRAKDTCPHTHNVTPAAQTTTHTYPHRHTLSRSETNIRKSCVSGTERERSGARERKREWREKESGRDRGKINSKRTKRRRGTDRSKPPSPLDAINVGLMIRKTSLACPRPWFSCPVLRSRSLHFHRYLVKY
jgi:hypothetical protein